MKFLMVKDLEQFIQMFLIRYSHKSVIKLLFTAPLAWKFDCGRMGGVHNRYHDHCQDVLAFY